MSREKFSIFSGLSIMSSDAISSVAYASEEILWVLIPVIGMISYEYMFEASLAIVFLLIILVFSYRQTIHSYPGGGGAYTVAKENLGTIPGLVAGASLSVDYLLTVAVSTCAGTAMLDAPDGFL
jgi:amino acid transporter